MSHDAKAAPRPIQPHASVAAGEPARPPVIAYNPYFPPRPAPLPARTGEVRAVRWPRD
ncbi:hypothetical protein [uncultured Methylobacterium sp.]|uniref:hypothetical protein n=1 Tax=uncultured Methylobacterium sp. TaxID=157278 RepID=UPI002627C555|nr:hypothetical protein [uncultured Methylobacterium sp.]